MPESNENIALAVQIQREFTFSALALTFGILGLAVQTAPFSGPPAARIAELLGWLLLLASGLSGLSRLEWLPKAYQALGLRQDVEERAHQLRMAEAKGSRVVHITSEQNDYPIEDLITKAGSEAAMVKTHIGILDKRTIRRYKLQKVCFVGGLIALLISRGWAPALAIFYDLR